MEHQAKGFRFPLNLQLFADGDGGDGGGNGEGGQDGQGQDGDKSGGGSGGQGGSTGGGDKQPFAVFPDEASFMSRVKREAKGQYSELLKTLGFEKAEDLQSIVEAHRASEEKNKTDLQKSNDALTKAQSDAQKATDLLNRTVLNSEARLKAIASGVKPERVEYALRIADLSGIEVKDGVADVAAIQTAIDKILTDMPELKGTTAPSSGGSDFNRGGGDGQGGGSSLLTWEAIEAMSTSDAEKRMPEIMEFMTKNPKRGK